MKEGLAFTLPPAQRRVERFEPRHADGFTLCRQQARDFPGERMEDALALLAGSGSAFTLRRADGLPLCFSGIARIDAGYGHAWAFMSAAAGPHMRFITGKVRDYLDVQLRERFRRIELVARADFAQAAKWAAKLGFTLEGPMLCAAPDGGHMLRFARINRGNVK